MDNSLEIFFILICSIIGLVYLYLTWNFNYWKNRNVYGPQPSIFFGNLPSIVRRHRNFNFEFADLYEKFKNSGNKLIGIFMTRNPAILILDPELARDILTNKFKSFAWNELSLWCNRKKEVVSVRHVFNIYDYAEWKERRTDLVSGFSDSKLQQTYSLLQQLNHKLTNFIKTEIDKTGGIIDIESMSYKYMVDFAANFVYGIDTNVLKSGIPKNPMYDRSRKLMDLSFKLSEQYYLFGLIPGLKQVVKDRFFDKDTDNYFIDVQKSAIELRLKNKNDRFDFLNYLLNLQEKKNLSDMDVVGHSISVVIDAVDTTAFVTLHTLFLLAYDQRVQEKLRMEINEHMNEDGEVSFKTLMNMEYLDQCVNESMRLFSPNPVLSKLCSEEIYLENNENQSIKIEPGMILHISCFAFHHDPDIYPEPEEFIPERFDNGEAKVLFQRGHFIPFSDGPRICAGMRLAQLQCKASIFEVIKNFQLKTCKRTQYAKYLSRSSRRYFLNGEIDIEFIAL